jgi:hypothetical protein
LQPWSQCEKRARGKSSQICCASPGPANQREEFRQGFFSFYDWVRELVDRRKILASPKLARLRYINHWNHDLEQTSDLGIDWIRGTEQHRDFFHGFPVEGNLELISGQMCALDPEVAAKFPVVSFDVTLPSVGKLEMPLDNHIPLVAVWGFAEQDLETVPGF